MEYFVGRLGVREAAFTIEGSSLPEHTDYPQPRLPSNDGKDYLAEVASVLKSADLTFGNLDGVVGYGNLRAGTP